MVAIGNIHVDLIQYDSTFSSKVFTVEQQSTQYSQQQSVTLLVVVSMKYIYDNNNSKI